MRRPRIRLRTIMVAVVFLSMAMTIVVQYLQLRQALAREQLLRARAEHDKASAQADLVRARTLLEQMNARLRERQPEPSAAALEP